MRTGLFFLGALLMLFAACSNDAGHAASSPSPLLTADSDRLWILAQAARVGNGKTCKQLYLAPDDPRYQARVPACDAWARDYADYLSINGFPDIQHAHLKDPAYWRWYVDTRDTIARCKSALGTLPVGLRDQDQRVAHQYQKNQCDPYEAARHNQKLTPAELGIHFR